MANFNDVFEDTQTIFTTLISKRDLDRVVRIKILTNNNLKEIGKVVKANDILNHIAELDVVIVLNEHIFEQLTDEQKIMVAEELIAPIHYDFEHDKLNITKPDLVTFSGIIRNFGFPAYEVLHESIKTLFKVETDKEADKKAANKKQPV